MSTRSIVAVPHGDSWRGRYVHSDGYPTDAWAYGYGAAEYVAYQFGPKGLYGDGRYGDGRFVLVPGWGQAFSHTEVTEDEWLDPTITNDTEWAYVLADDGLWVLKCHWDDPPTLVGSYRWELAEPDWKYVEGIEEEDED